MCSTLCDFIITRAAFGFAPYSPGPRPHVSLSLSLSLLRSSMFLLSLSLRVRDVSNYFRELDTVNSPA